MSRPEECWIAKAQHDAMTDDQRLACIKSVAASHGWQLLSSPRWERTWGGEGYVKAYEVYVCDVDLPPEPDVVPDREGALIVLDRKRAK